MRSVLQCIVWVICAAVCSTEPEVRSPALMGGVTTLYAHDPEQAGISFLDGKSGHEIRHRVSMNRWTSVEYVVDQGDTLRFGAQGGDRAEVRDLGSGDELSKKLGFPETVGYVQGYTSLCRIDGQVWVSRDYQVAGDDYVKSPDKLTTIGLQPLDLSLFEVGLARTGLASRLEGYAAIKPGHIYIAKIVHGIPGTPDVWAKVLVLESIPGQSATIRWQVL